MATAQAQIMERLKLCYEDIAGVNHASEYPMAGGPSGYELPYIETYQGPDSTEWVSSEIWHVTADFIGLAYLAELNSDNDPDSGLVSYALAQPFKERVRRYFMEHPRLQTSSANPLTFLVSNINYRSGALGVLEDKDFIGFSFTLTISWQETKGTGPS